ncbi:Inositol monophosphatase 2 [Clonorchis sinensis]|uniref:Inositol-1-monophosphatase n=1 Tax=Clonorchis sinensis TaxID=79923 RepID=A0A8T1M1W9_CLOSI|nr:Inositol monophosphatase 2 [Clonorchis sinensis]
MVRMDFVKTLAKKAGQIIKDGYYTIGFADEKASYADLVTEYDRKVEEFLKAEILAVHPDHKIIAEEGYSGSAVLTQEPTWIIDPIDGTSNFVSRFPFICVSIAFYVEKEPVLAVVYNPIQQQMYSAEKGHGAFLNEEPIHVTNEKDMSKALILTDWGGDRQPENLDKKTNNMRRIISKARGLRTMGSAALHICQVAGGTGDGFYEFGIHCWDYAAGLLIVREAGGFCCNYDGSPVDLMSRNVICASTPELAHSLISIIQPVLYPRD